MTVLVVVAESVTLNAALVVPLLPSVTVTLATASEGSTEPPESSSVIVPSPTASTIGAPVASDRFTLKVSLGSDRVSPITWTVTCFAVSPGAKMSVPPAGL